MTWYESPEAGETFGLGRRVTLLEELEGKGRFRPGEFHAQHHGGMRSMRGPLRMAGKRGAPQSDNLVLNPSSAPLPSCVSLDKLLDLSEFQAPHLRNDARVDHLAVLLK